MKLKIMKYKLFITLLLFTLRFVSYAQSHVPKVGDVITFYPASDNIKSTVSGYDCFYNSESLIKDGKLKAKQNFRFMANQFGLTPYSEIEGHTFIVKDKGIENPEAKKLEKKSYLVFFEREDGFKVTLRIPFIWRDEDNQLTHAMVFKLNDNYCINIPYCLVKELQYLKDNFEKNDIICYTRGNLDNQKLKRNSFTNQMKHLGGFVPDNIFDRDGTCYICEEVNFVNVEGYYYKQPIVLCKYEERNITIPAFEFRGLGTLTYGIEYRMEDFFEKRSDVFNHLADKKITKRMLSLLGKRLVYGRYGEYSKDDAGMITKSGSNVQYTLKPKSFYFCDSYDLYYDKGYGLSICAILRDSIDTKFQVPLRLFKFNESEEQIKWDNLFILEDDYVEHTRKYEEKEATIAKEAEKYTKKYGKEVGEKIAKGLCTEERYLNLRKRFGEKTSLKILKGKFEIGMTLEAVRESLRGQYFEPTNTFDSAGGLYQQYQYLKYSPVYLMFRNGKLISILNSN